MGANFNSMTLDGKLTAEQVKKHFNQLRENDRIEYGADPYNGSFSALPHITVCDKVFETEREAENYCEEHSEKWENAVAVKAKNITTKTIKKPTFNGKEECGYGLNGHDPVCKGHTSKDFVPADQLTDGQKAKLKKLFCNYEELRAAANITQQHFSNLVRQLNSVEADFKDYTNLRKVRAAHVAAHKKFVKAEDAFKELQKRFREKLYKTKEVDNGLIWVLGGWCAE